MRIIELYYETELLCPKTGRTLEYPRLSDAWADMMRNNGYIVTDTEREIPPVNEENYP